MYRKKKIAIGMAITLGTCIYLLFAFQSLNINIPFVELKHEEMYRKNKKINISIGIYTGQSPFHLYETREIVNPVLTAAAVNDVDADFVADPFMVFEGNNWYMFFEVMNKKSGHGDIGLAKSVDGVKWEYQKIVLDEPFHLSYPHVFLSENSYYMIPETNEQKTIRLYKATAFPFKWKFEAILMNGLQFTDPTIFKYDHKWWLFAETDPKGDGTLRLYYSTEIHGPWKEHPESPIVVGDENIARPAGRVISFNNAIFRVAQDDWPTYGNKVRIFQIDHLTTAKYVEHELCDVPIFGSKKFNVKSKLPRWRSAGVHQMDAHQIGNGNWMACVDGINRTTLHKQWVVRIPVPWTKREIK
jgi:hypothetical protein